MASQASAFFAQFNRNKQGVTIDLRSERGKDLLRQLVRKADVLVENFRPGVMDKLGRRLRGPQDRESPARLHRDQRLRSHRTEQQTARL